MQKENNSISHLVKEAHETARQHGWWEEGKEPNFPTLLALCHSELSEALEEYRNGEDPAANITYYTTEKQGPQGIPTELADVCIRIFDMCGYYGIDLEKAIVDKIAFNQTRPYKHGGKVV